MTFLSMAALFLYTSFPEKVFNLFLFLRLVLIHSWTGELVNLPNFSIEILPVLQMGDYYMSWHTLGLGFKCFNLYICLQLCLQ